MSEPANGQLVSDELTGVPGLGPVRRRLLQAAGVTTRTALLSATVEQIVSITGMPRALAEQIHAFIAQNVSVPIPSPVIGEETHRADDSVTGTTDPAFEEERGVPQQPVPLGDDAPQTTRLERATLRAQTAIADASRRTEPGSKLSAMLLRFARLTDELPRRVTPDTRGGVIKRIIERIETITQRLETLTTSKKEARPLSTKRAKKLQQRLKRTRDSIKRTLKTSASN